MTDSQELERQEPRMAAVLQVTPEQAKVAVDNLRAVISNVLQEKRDYWQIPGTPKPSMLKPGAERLQAFFGLGSQYVEEEHGWDPEGRFFAKVKCRITNREGQVLAESAGWCDDGEQKKGGGPKWKGNKNTIIKIAQKRAYVGAILTATATSDHFTQDVEDEVRGTTDEAAGPDWQTNKALPVHLRDRPVEPNESGILVNLYMSRTGKTTQEAMDWVDANAVKMKTGDPSFIWSARQCFRLLGMPQKFPPIDDVLDAEIVSDPAPDEPDFGQLLDDRAANPE